MLACIEQSRGEGIRGFIASDGPTGIALASKSPIDVVVLAFKMPDMNGGQVAEMLFNRQPDLPIVICTGFFDAVPEWLRWLAAACVEKRDGPDALLSAIQQVIAHKRYLLRLLPPNVSLQGVAALRSRWQTFCVVPLLEGARIMPIAKELTIRVEDTPGTLAQCCQPLAERDVNILALEAFEREGQSVIRMVVDDPATAKKLLDANRIYYTETEVAQVVLPHRSRELFRAASRLSEARININYAYCGTEPGTNMSLVVFGVTDVAKAVSLLEEDAKAA